jgi:hypothetical protein
MEKHEFLAAVHTEAAAIRVAATIEERSRLNIDTFQPTHMEHCIYGQMTGDCFSHRAVALMDKCCVQYFSDMVDESELDDVDFAFFNDNVVEKAADYSPIDSGIYRYFSAIEAYITLPEAKVAELMQFIKGEVEEFEP